MHMIEMLGIMTVVFFLTLLLLCLYRGKINIKIGNAAFIIFDLIFFSFWTYASYQQGGMRGNGWLTLGNISPLMFTLILLLPFMKSSVRDFVQSAIAFLWVGMFAAMLISPEHAYLFSYRTEANLVYTSEAACHLLCSLFGIYLIITKQVKPDFKHWLKSMAVLYSIISIAVTLNFIYHRSYFGMDPYGNYGIYMIDIFGSFYATFAAYYLGILVVLTVGMQCGYLLLRWTSHHSEEL